KLNLDNPHLQTVTNLKSKVCEILGVKPSVLLIEKIREGCLEVILLVPKHLVRLIFGDHLTEITYKEQLLEASVIFFSGKDFIIEFIVSYDLILRNLNVTLMIIILSSVCVCACVCV
ncbi:MAG: hypothetical protein MJE68_25775, partial [Proteobacteria bacterium]|nr:hypothetical protein [Pseudomonadota bacterium]